MKKNLKAENSSNDNYLTNVKETLSGFAARHIGLSTDDINHMLDTLGYKDIDALLRQLFQRIFSIMICPI